MMDIYASDEEKGEAIKQWWRKNGLSVAMGIALGFAVVGGMKYKQGQEQSMKVEASQAYQAVSGAVAAEDGVVAETEAKRLMADFSDSSYATLAAFKMAEQKMASKDVAASKTYLEWIVDNAILSGQKDIARLRLARLLASESEFDAALALTNGEVNEAFVSLYSEVEGDIYTAQSKPSEAYEAYKAAFETADSGRKAALQLKLDNVAVANES